MASRFYALEKGQQKVSVTEAAAAQSKTVEIAIDLADFGGLAADRSEVMRLIEEIKLAILEDQWPPA